MSVIKGLKNINALLDKKADEAGPKVKWLKLADGQAVKIRFIEELDEDSANYNEKRGLILKAVTGLKKCIVKIQGAIVDGVAVFVSIATYL